ncbi:YggS family pyridoxal phosphate-dependent enzyme [Zwartia panacis]|uniref:YggS family pyridoxal phosphate-dependent enzyme n=1 Tax=Zwartia panacis TaxID=2683345 RepID=UPI0025B4921E|nr:YggS family pyridoxal phosphate-dependent enzyme [Zwartia panacis]MDN4017197.1 YggS family pyridoxal phosphate-dependent enzyme [Zwartia panacis]
MNTELTQTPNLNDAVTIAMSERIVRIKDRMAQACARVGRDPSEVTLLPVSKTFDDQAIRRAVSLGYKRFGENRTQEIAQKTPLLADCDIQWVVIGQLQTNKAKDVARLAHELQSLDRLELAEALDRRLQLEGRAIDVLVQVKTSPEETKAGLEPTGLIPFLKQISGFQTLRVKGLMTMAILSEDESAVRRCFAQLRQLRDQARQEAISGIELDRLSMGMSGDFELAIEEGSTEIRVGSAIFGARDYSA